MPPRWSAYTLTSVFQPDMDPTTVTNPLKPDTDGDGLCDGPTVVSPCVAGTVGEDTNKDGKVDSTETNPLDVDTDDDGLCDGQCGTKGEFTEGTNALLWDTDGDGLSDGVERGVVTPTKDTLLSKFVADKDPGAAMTSATDPDSDDDGLCDGPKTVSPCLGIMGEDKNANGKVDSGETNPTVPDTDGDGLSDGLKEDKNGNGIVDKTADGTLLETDPLAKDSDVDGICDGLCASLGEDENLNGVKDLTESDPRIPDTDLDGLRDGQETAGWRVGIWYERTMEKKTDYQVTSLRLDPDSDDDGLNDLSEFLSGSDPTKRDTDGDGIEDKPEVDNKYNVTGIEGTPPAITNVQNFIEVQCIQIWFICIPTSANVKVEFDISDNVAIGRVDIKVKRFFGLVVEPRTVQLPAGAKAGRVSETFGFSLLEAIGSGADVNISAYDVNGNGAWGDFHIDSLFEAIAKAVLAFFAAIAKLIVEAISAAFNWIFGMISDVLGKVFAPFLEAIDASGRELAKAFQESSVYTASRVTLDDAIAFLVDLVDYNPLLKALQLIAYVIFAIQIILFIVSFSVPGIGLIITAACYLLVTTTITAIVLGSLALGQSPNNPLEGQSDLVAGWATSVISGFIPVQVDAPEVEAIRGFVLSFTTSLVNYVLSSQYLSKKLGKQGDELKDALRGSDAFNLAKVMRGLALSLSVPLIKKYLPPELAKPASAALSIIAFLIVSEGAIKALIRSDDMDKTGHFVAKMDEVVAVIGWAISFLTMVQAMDEAF